MKIAAAKLILQGHGMANGMFVHDRTILVEIRDESFSEKIHRDYVFGQQQKQGLTLLLLAEPNRNGSLEILFPQNPPGDVEDPAYDVWRLMCDLLRNNLGPNWRRAWIDENTKWRWGKAVCA